jgi:glycerol-1-phosphate dehydrogenase [NAD(P)+]
MHGYKKLTDEVQPPEDVLVDLDILCSAPKAMTSSGFADIVGKFTCLADWRLAAAVKGEKIHAEAFDVMARARTECVDALDGLIKSEPTAVARLIDALIMAGKAMALCGNSRPASGSEHHQSHFLEMDFVRRGEKVPLHGLKVAIGTLVSLTLYNYLKDNKVAFNGSDKVYELAVKLPTVDEVQAMLVKMGCPVRFSEIGVRKETMEQAIESAYTVRDRYTVLTLAHELNLTEKIKPILMEKYF